VKEFEQATGISVNYNNQMVSRDLIARQDIELATGAVAYDVMFNSFHRKLERAGGRAGEKPSPSAAPGGSLGADLPGGPAQILPTAGHRTSGGRGSQGEMHDWEAFSPRASGSFRQTLAVLALGRGGRRGGYAESGQGRSS